MSTLGAVDASQAILMEILGFQLLGIFMAGGYFVTGFRTTYFGGWRDAQVSLFGFVCH